MRRLTIHLPLHQLRDPLVNKSGFYGKVAAAFRHRGWRVEQGWRPSIHADPEYDRPGFHLVHQGLVRQKNVLNTGCAYISRFWYADPNGIFGKSSIADLEFDPESIAANTANGFFRRLHRRLVLNRRSRHTQPAQVMNFEPGAIAVFLQGPSEPMARAAHVTEPEMLRMILGGAGGRQVLVKMHPRNADPDTREALDRLLPEHPNLRLVDANIHDMLDGAVACCSISSSLGIEAMLHKVPVILFGKTDFRHCAVTLRRSDDFAAGLERAAGTDWPYARFLYWFLQVQNLNLGRDGWDDRLLVRLERSADGPAFGARV